jgi:hypothetical protein|tara:strand:- start:263 stop:658 length:396 start_codon:yes stop_codon:yes gene_type:complete
MVKIDAATSLESFRRFTITSTCSSFAPESYTEDPEVFPEREESFGSIYVEAADKVTLKKIRGITFVNARDVLGIIYNSKTGNTNLKWRQFKHNSGKVTGEASSNSLVNLVQSGVITLEWVEKYVQKMAQKN